MRYILILLLLISYRCFSQSVTMSVLNNKLDSLSLSMDSTVFKQKIAVNSSYIVLDTLTLPQNSFGFFTIYYCSYDTVGKFTGFGEEGVFITRIGTAYSNPFITPIMPYSSAGLSTHQVVFSIIQSGGLVLIRADGFDTANPIRWHLVRQAKISPL